MNTDVDHLVVVADTLDQGSAWCEAVLGATPLPGGRHALMGTHNRLLAIGSAAYPDAYLEVIAIDPDAPPPGRARWFGMDDPALQAAVRQAPRLHHAVLRTPNVEMLRWGLVTLGLQPGEPVAAERQTARGLLRWRILLRPDGQIAADGALPTLIEWQGEHPAAALPPSPVRLAGFAVHGLSPRVAELLRLRRPAAARDALVGGPAPAGATLSVLLDTPRGPVTLHALPPAPTFSPEARP